MSPLLWSESRGFFTCILPSLYPHSTARNRDTQEQDDRSTKTLWQQWQQIPASIPKSFRLSITPQRLPWNWFVRIWAAGVSAQFVNLSTA
ncbi:hypothetical protein NQZ68_008078 [Dissostichus eleginoides]|nr:hypothetical protein NQZ68_008078 [Dissostichus eleginoides]